MNDKRQFIGLADVESRGLASLKIYLAINKDLIEPEKIPDRKWKNSHDLQRSVHF